MNSFVLEAGIHQKELLAFLFRSYDPAERPVKNEEESLQVTVGLSVQQIVDVVSVVELNIDSRRIFLFN